MKALFQLNQKLKDEDSLKSSTSQDCRDGSAVKNAGCSPRGSQHPYLHYFSLWLICGNHQ